MRDLQIEHGSFRDRNGRIFYRDGEVFRTLSEDGLVAWNQLSATQFFQDLQDSGEVVHTHLVPSDEVGASTEWAGVLQHERIPFVSYPYEWSFGMLRDAALLQIRLVLAALEEGMTVKDGTSYNIQWRGSQPVFIDTLSFEPLREGEPWAGYKQFCQLFLYPLMLQAYKNVGFQAWLRGRVDGIEPEECAALMSTRDLLRAGVFTHVFLQSKLQNRYAGSQRDVKSEIQKAGFRKELIQANLRKLRSIVARLEWSPAGSAWSDYAGDNTYSEAEHESKADFVRKAVSTRARNLAWDLGCNTGVFSQIVAEHSDYVVAMDADHLSIERFYRGLRENSVTKILPLVNNLADPSPDLGWRGLERKSLPARSRPDFVLALALIHHIVISANIPLEEFVNWLAELGGELVIEWVGREDPMVRSLLRNKPDQYRDYSHEHFEDCLNRWFEVVDRQDIQSGGRVLYFAKPR